MSCVTELLKALHARGHQIVFYEKDVEWYASNRDLLNPDFCEVRLYDSWAAALPRIRKELRDLPYPANVLGPVLR